MTCSARQLIRLSHVMPTKNSMQQSSLLPSSGLLGNKMQYRHYRDKPLNNNKARRVPIRGGTWTRPTHLPYPLPPEAYEMVNADNPPPPKTLTEFEEVPGAFAFYERLLPDPYIPIPPPHASYPTPSGWVPPAAKIPDLPYYVGRSRNHNLPVYLDKHFFETRLLTRVNRVEGDIWKFKDDLLKHIEPVNKYPYPIEQHPCQVSEVKRSIRLKGNYVMEVKQFLLQCGF